MFRPPEYAALINPIACNAFAMRCEGRADIEQTLVVDTGLTPGGTPINAQTMNVTTQSQVCDAKMFICPFIKLLTPVSPDYAGQFFLASFTFSIDGELVINNSAVEMHLVCPACQIAVQPSPPTTDPAAVRLLLGRTEDEMLGCCQMFFLPNGTNIIATLNGIPTGAGPLRINTGVILANYTTKARQGCLFGVGALDAQQQAYPVTYPCNATFGAAVVPTTTPAIPAASVSYGPGSGVSS